MTASNWAVKKTVLIDAGREGGALLLSSGIISGKIIFQTLDCWQARFSCHIRKTCAASRRRE
jgi:hypothetical protein